MTALPPKGFVGAGTVQRVEQCNPPWWSSEKPPAGSPAAARWERGLHYQQVVEHAIRAWADTRSAWFPKDAYPDNRIKRSTVTVEFGPWFRFVGSNQLSIWRWCQPDVLLTSAGLAVVLEVKLAFEPKAWWQLSALYRPVVEKVLDREVAIGAICKSFDPVVRSRVPCNLELTTLAPSTWLEALSASSRWATELPFAGHARNKVLSVLQWKRPSIDSISESAARITSANQSGSR